MQVLDVVKLCSVLLIVSWDGLICLDHFDKETCDMQQTSDEDIYLIANVSEQMAYPCPRQSEICQDKISETIYPILYIR